jgi:hypothetical protein
MQEKEKIDQEILNNETKKELALINKRLNRIENLIVSISDSIEEKSINLGKYGILVAIWAFLYQKLEGVDLIIFTLLLGAITIYFIWKDKILIKKEWVDFRDRFKGSLWIIIIVTLIAAAILIFVLDVLGRLSF